MADTYSTALKVRKIEQGGYDPAWASRFNADVVDILDAAISGRVSISIGSSTTPSLAALVNGTLSDSHYFWLVFTGTPASAVTLTVPASVTFKQYLIDNQTGQTMTVKYSATAGVAVPTGKIVPVLCDGTTVVYDPVGFSGTFTATLTGVTTSVTGTTYYERIGDSVTLLLPTLSGTSNATTCTITGLPSFLTPTRDQGFEHPIIADNGVFALGTAQVKNTGVITCWDDSVATSTTSWVNSGTKSVFLFNCTYLML